MILGICGGIDDDAVKLVKDIGYRYIETWLPNLCGEANREKYTGFLKALDKHKMRCEVGQFAFPGEYNPEGKQTREALEKIRENVYNMLDATSDLCIERVVIGGGGARFLPSPGKYFNALEQCAEILKYAVSPALSDFGVIATVEPLVKGETPLINTTAEGVHVARLANRANIKVMVDLYHAGNEDKNFDDFAKYKGYILHSHMGKPQPRVHPSPDDGHDYAPFFAALRSAGFNGRMSLEAGSSCPDYKASLENAFKVLEPLL